MTKQPMAVTFIPEVRQIVTNWQTLRGWIKRGQFPEGTLLAPRCRGWTEVEIAQWLEQRGRVA